MLLLLIFPLRSVLFLSRCTQLTMHLGVVFTNWVNDINSHGLESNYLRSILGLDQIFAGYSHSIITAILEYIFLVKFKIILPKARRPF